MLKEKLKARATTSHLQATVNAASCEAKAR